MKKMISLALACVMILGILCGCGGGTTAPTAAPAPGGSAAPAPAPAGGEYLLRIGSAAGEIQPYCAVLYDLEKNVEERTGGAVQVEIYPAAQIGGEEDLNRKTMTGAIEACITSVSSVNSYLPGLYVYYLPFMYTDLDTIQTVRNSELNTKMLSATEDIGMVNVGLTTSGGTTIASKKEIKSVADMKGFKMRSPSLEAYLSIYKALGINATPIPFNECFTAVQQGTVDGMENSLSTIGSNNYNEAGIKYVWATNQIFGWMGYWVNQSWLNKLPAEYKDIVLEEFKIASDTSFDDTWKMDQDYIDAQDPFIVHVPTAEELAEMQALTAGIVDEKMPDLIKANGQDMMEDWFEMIGYDYKF